MRGADERSGSLFSYIDLEYRIPEGHPLRAIRVIVNTALADLNAEFEAMYAPIGRPSIPPEKLLRSSLLQAFYSIRSERPHGEAGFRSAVPLVRGVGHR